MLDTGATVLESPAEGSTWISRGWRIAVIVVGFQVLSIFVAVALFSALGLANDGIGSCGGV